jgi:hypothetical protein
MFTPKNDYHFLQSRWNLVLMSLLFLSVLMVPGITLGQSVNGNQGTSVLISVSATLESEVRIETINNINFGTVSASTTEIYINPRSDANAGLMRIVGSPNNLITVSYIERQELTRVGGGSSLFFEYEVSAAAQDDQLTSEQLTLESRQIRLSNNGEYYFWIGGRLNLEGITFGLFEGEFTLEIDNI